MKIESRVFLGGGGGGRRDARMYIIGRTNLLMMMRGNIGKILQAFFKWFGGRERRQKRERCGENSAMWIVES